MLTVGAMPMTAGMGHERLVVALGALHPHLGTGRSSANLHGTQSLEVGRQECVLVVCEEFGFESLDNR